MTTCSAGLLTSTTCTANPCSGNVAPANGWLCDCPVDGTLTHGASCQPTCDTGYTVSGATTCSAGNLQRASCLIVANQARVSIDINFSFPTSPPTVVLVAISAVMREACATSLGISLDSVIMTYTVQNGRRRHLLATTVVYTTTVIYPSAAAAQSAATSISAASGPSSLSSTIQTALTTSSSNPSSPLFGVSIPVALVATPVVALAAAVEAVATAFSPEQSGGGGSGLPISIVVAAGAGGVILGVVIGVWCCCRQRRKRKREVSPSNDVIRAEEIEERKRKREVWPSNDVIRAEDIEES